MVSSVFPFSNGKIEATYSGWRDMSGVSLASRRRAKKSME